MVAEQGETLGSALLGLREARGLGATEAARRAGVGRNTLFQWETGQRTPRGASLERLLDALDAPERLRSRLLALADPRHARIALAHRPLGSPIELGQILRAMRLRRGMTQADAARAAGVSQGAFARWEGGGDVPDASTLHAAAFALGASPEEATALTLVQGGAGRTPANPEAAIRRSIDARWWEDSLHEVVQLGIEADAWWRATLDPRWDAVATSAMAKRAFRYFGDGRLEAADATARRAVRLARRPEARSEAVMALDVVERLARRRGDPPGAAIRLAESWAESIPKGDSPEGDSKVWAVKIAARAHAAAGDLETALATARPIPDLLPFQAVNAPIAQRERVEFASVYIAGNVPERALPLLAPNATTLSWQTQNAAILLANRHPLPENTLRVLRQDRSHVPVELKRAVERVLRKLSAPEAPLPYFS